MPTCMFKTDPRAGLTLEDRECPNLWVLEDPQSVRAVNQCADCLIAYACEIQEPEPNGTWGPVRSLGEILHR